MSSPNAPPGDASPAAPTQAHGAPMRFSSSHMESSVTRLLVATKMLLESLTKWAAGACSEEHVSDIYVRLGNDFNAARLAFGSYGISMAELESVPDDLRACLEACLSEEASQAALDRHLPQVREIVVGLLQGLKSKQALYKEYLLASRQSRGGNPTPPASSSSPHNAGTTPYPPSTRSASNVSSRSSRSARAHLSSSTVPATDVQAARRESYQLLEQSHPRRGVMGPRSPPDHSRTHSSQSTPSVPAAVAADVERHTLTDEPMVPYPTSSGASPPGRDKSLPPAPVQMPSRHAASVSVSAASTGSRRKAQHHHSSSSISVAQSLRRSPLPTIDSQMPMSFPHTPGEQDDGSDPSLRALKSRDALERRASKRFSAYTLNKMGISPSGFNAGLANMSPTPKRNRAPTTPSLPNLSPQKHADTLPDVPLPDEPLPMLPSPGRSATTGQFARGPKSSKRRLSHPSKSLPSNMPQSGLGIETMPEYAQDGLLTNESTLVPAPVSAGDDPATPGTEGAIPSDLGPASTLDSGENLVDTPPVPVQDAEAATLPQSLATSHLSPAGAPHSIDVFVQLGRLTKKATLTLEMDSPLTVARLQMLFVDRFGYSPGQDDFPPIYIKDPSTGVVYELEDLNDVHSGTLLTLNIDSLDQVRQHLDVSLGTLTRELRELKTAFNEQKERARETPTSQQVQLLLAQAASSGGLPPAVSSGASMSAPLSAIETSAREKISNEDFAAAGQRVALLARSATRASRPAPGPEASAAPAELEADLSLSGVAATTEDAGNTSIVLSGTAMAEDLQRQYEAVQRLRQEMAVMKQVQREFSGDVGGLLRELREQNKRVRALVSQDAPVQRSFIEAGKAQVDTQSQEVLTLVEDLQDTVDDLKMDVIQRKVTPRPQALKKIHADIAAAMQGLEQLERYVQSVKPAWKKTWEQELKVIVEEQEFLRHQEGLIMDLRDDQTALSDVFDQIQKVLRLRSAAARQVSGSKEGPGGFPALRPVGFIPPPPDEEHKGLSTVALELRGQAVDHARRLRALQAAERAWAKDRSEKEKDEFAQELAGFVDHKSLRRTGGHLEAERIRQKRDEATRLAMLTGDGQQVGGAPVNVGPIVKPKRLIWGKNRDSSPLPQAGRPSAPRSASTATSTADTSVASAPKSPQLGVESASSPQPPPSPPPPEPAPSAAPAAPETTEQE